MGSSKIKHWHIVTICLALYDVIVVNLAYFLALWFRYDVRYSLIDRKYLDAFYRFAPIYTAITILIFAAFRLYKSVWKYVSFVELIRTFMANVVSFIVMIAGTLIFFERMPASFYIFGAVLQFCLTIAIRFAYRFISLLRANKVKDNPDKSKKVMLIGAGNAGQMILKDTIKARELNDKIVCIIDDNQNKWGRYIDGVKIVGGRDEILYACQEYDVEKIYVAVPSASPEERRDLLNICKETGCEIKVLPGMFQLMNGDVSIADMKPVQIEDLLGRETIKVNMDEVFSFITGKVILVTGGGGSIGSELCRQIASHNPKQLIIFDVYENNAYEIQQELKKKYPDLNLTTLIGSVRDSRKMFHVFETYRPELVYHAAAHKHVPLMEDSPCEAIKNNVIGTYKTAFAAMTHGCKRFVLISTDKAVNPTNIMGASKRLCEMVIQALDSKIREGKAQDIPQFFTHEIDDAFTMETKTNELLKDVKTEFVAVRFGNVLGSNGSVIPLFRKQIAAGGPVTVTHPDIIRYFMTIPEAVSLVLQAGTYAHGGEIFVLDMGSPVKIDTLARNLIKLSGYKPDVDIKVEYTGLRPGEKLYEEKLMAEEGLKKTDNELIHIGCPIPFDVEIFLGQVKEMMELAYRNRENISDYVETMVSTYHPAGKHGTDAKTEAYKQQIAEVK